MIQHQDFSWEPLQTMAVTVATNNTSAVYLDASADGGAQSVGFIVAMQPSTATNSSNKLNSLKIVHSDTTDQTSFVSIFEGTTNSTAGETQFVLPTQNSTSLDAVIAGSVKTAGRKRYIGVVVATGNTHGDQVGVFGFRSPKETPAVASRADAFFVV